MHPAEECYRRDRELISCSVSEFLHAVDKTDGYSNGGYLWRSAKGVEVAASTEDWPVLSESEAMLMLKGVASGLVCFCASHIDGVVRLKRFEYMLDSWAAQEVPVALHVSM